MLDKKFELDKYYTPEEIVTKVVNIVQERLPEISQIIEPSAGNGSFISAIKNMTDNYSFFDIAPEHPEVIQQDFLTLELPYVKNTLVLGNPPFGNRFSLGKKFLKKASTLGDYIAFILPASQLNNQYSFQTFGLISSIHLGKIPFQDGKASNIREVNCCLNIYSRYAPIQDLSHLKKVRSIIIYRQDCKDYDSITDYDVRMVYWGMTAGKILTNTEEKYAGEYKIKILDNANKQEILDIFYNTNWKEKFEFTVNPRIKIVNIYQVIREVFPNIE